MASTESSQQIGRALQTISESVYMGMCLKIGTPHQVAIRRHFVGINELLNNKTNPFIIMKSGSLREGFRLEGSDVDVMFWTNDHRVLWDFSQARCYNTDTQALILCDSSDSPPGFTLLWLPLEEASVTVKSSCVRANGTLYISSARYREIMRPVLRPDSTVHGPCSSGGSGRLEYDYAHCFASDFWPPSAYSWIERCQAWPPPNVVDDIVKSGCHFVAIGHKLGKHADDEWRISFSQAEHKLVFAMNHTQFLTYGMLKLFLKEIINNAIPEEEKLLCSYHMKTGIFWAIQQNTILDWCPQNFLGGFWVCFKLLLKWVYEGVCPNLFIPENNMFLNNVFGNAQKNLFTRLYGLYEIGISFLVQSTSVRSHFMNTLCNPRLFVCTDERTLISEVVLDKELYFELYINDSLPSEDLHLCIEDLNIIQQLIRSNVTPFHAIMLQKLAATLLQSSAFLLHNEYTKTADVNKL